MLPLYVIHDGELDLSMLESLSPSPNLLVHPVSENALPEAGSRVILHLCDESIIMLLHLAIEREWVVTILPHPRNRAMCDRLGLERDPRAALSHALSTDPRKVHLLTCNGLPVLSSVVAGEPLALDVREAPNSRWLVLESLLRGVLRLHPFRFNLTTAKEQVASTAGIGWIALTGPGHPYLGAILRDLLCGDDGRCTVLLLAPRSVLEFIWLLVRILVLRSLSVGQWPSSVGLVRSRRITMGVGKGVDFSLDGVPMSAEKLELEVLERPLLVHVGRRYPQPGALAAQTKDTVRLGRLPAGESVQMLSGAPLPFFNHASEDEYRELFVSLKETAIFSRSFLALMVMSSLLALFGLYANSAPVIIGAMILAPLMGPIISLSMGLARSHPVLIRESVKTLLLGIGATLLCAIVVSKFMPLRTLTGEISARMSPNLLDLGVAVVSGVAGAYAHAKEEVAKSLAGVAIAVALVPPLCVAGIGLGWLNSDVVTGSALLFATNLFGIAVAGSFTFLVLGFAPFRLARTGLILSMVMLTTVAVPLAMAFEQAIKKNHILETLSVTPLSEARDMQITPLSVHLGREWVVRLQITTPEPIQRQELDAIQSRLEKALGRSVSVEASVILKSSGGH